MGILDKLADLFRSSTPPPIHNAHVAPPDYSMPLPQDSVYHLPNPAPHLRGAYEPSPNRVHTPGAKRKLWFQKHDQANADIIRTPALGLQQYFNQVQELPPVRVFTRVNGVKASKYFYQKGQMQIFIPEPGRRDLTSVWSAPPVLLSRPLRSKTYQGEKTRKPIVAKAPKRNRGVSL